jgi:putative ABC transport system substrate-binding protein
MHPTISVLPCPRTEKAPDAVLMVTDILTVLNRKRVIDFAATHCLPAIYGYALLAHEGGLMAYGPNPARVDFDQSRDRSWCAPTR